MTRLPIHVEGQTEETFVNEILSSHLSDFGFSSVSARIIGNARLRARRGGIQSWTSVKRDVINHLREDAGAVATTMVDFYGLPQNGDAAWPGRQAASHQAFATKALTVEAALHADVVAEMGGGFNAKR